MSKAYKSVKPLFKYIGGKTWLRDELRKEISTVLKDNPVSTYAEPFAGGLGAFLGIYDLLKTHEVNTVVLSDINASLIKLYANIKNNKEELINHFIAMESEFATTVPAQVKEVKDKELLKQLLINAEAYFKQVRQDFNASKGSGSVVEAARLVFLQKHSFNGVYRENSKGQYNTPFNWSGNTMINTFAQKIEELHEVFSLFDIEFVHQSYEDMDYHDDCIYYLDPPYINEDIIENKYNKDHFTLEQQLKLIQRIEGLNFIYSNHHSQVLIDQLSVNQGISIRNIPRKNIMSASAQSRQDDKVEILATHKRLNSL